MRSQSGRKQENRDNSGGGETKAVGLSEAITLERLKNSDRNNQRIYRIIRAIIIAGSAIVIVYLLEPFLMASVGKNTNLNIDINGVFSFSKSLCYSLGLVGLFFGYLFGLKSNKISMIKRKKND